MYQVIVSGSQDATLRLWSLTDFSCLRTFQGHSGAVLYADFILPTSLQILSTAADGIIKLWNIKDNECVASLDHHTDKVHVSIPVELLIPWRRCGLLLSSLMGPQVGLRQQERTLTLQYGRITLKHSKMRRDKKSSTCYSRAYPRVHVVAYFGL